jgi:hypothetical protein
MTTNREDDNPKSQIFHASKVWTSNVYGAAVAGIGAAILISAMVVIMAWLSPHRAHLSFAAGLILMEIGTLLGLYPGNLIAATPFAVELEEGKGIRLYAPLKKVYIPIEEVKKVESSFLRQGTVVRLSRRHGLLTGFSIHWGFGREGQELSRAIQDELARRQ